jgi:hypothetical protein
LREATQAESGPYPCRVTNPPVDPGEKASQPTPPATAKHRLPSGFSTLRDLITFIAGLAVILNEVFLSLTVEPYALGVGIALAGLPLALQADERRSSK